jgi:hypothetical protein
MLPIPTSQSQIGALEDVDASLGLQPDLVRCAKAAVQPGWVFEGACAKPAVKRAGMTVHLGLYKGYTLALGLPRNDAAAQAHIVVVDATGNRDIKPLSGKAFTNHPKAFYYLKIVNRDKPIRFNRGTHVAIGLKGLFGAAPCGMATLVKFKTRFYWKPIPVTATPAAGKLRYIVPATRYPALRSGSEYLAFFCSSSPTPTPSPSPSTTPTTPTSATPSPSSSASAPPPPTPTPPPNCFAYQTPQPSSVNPPIPVTINDSSGLGVGIYLYVTASNGASGSAIRYEYLAKNGKFKDFAAGKPAPPFPLSCFPGSTNSSGKTFLIPSAPSARLWIAYATPAPSPHPLQFVGTGGPAYGGTQFSAPVCCGTGAVTTPYDFFEYAYPSNGVTGEITYDTTQVDALGLPMLVTATTSGTPPPAIGITGNSYMRLAKAMTKINYFSGLPVAQTFNGRNILLRIVNPQHGQPYGVPPLYFLSSNYYGGKYSLGYLGYVLAQYQKQTFEYNLTPVNASYSIYCGTSDGTSNFLFYASKGSCPATPPSPLPATIPVSAASLETSGSPCSSNIFAEANTAGYAGVQLQLWKAITEDFNRGVMLSASPHPVGLTTVPKASPSAYYGNSINNQFASLLHQYYQNNLAYGFPYDDSANQESKMNVAPTVKRITISIQRLPPPHGPHATVTPAPTPPPCT